MERSCRSREDDPELVENHKCHVDAPSFFTELTSWSIAVWELPALGCVTFCKRANIYFAHRGLPSSWHRADSVTPPNPSIEQRDGWISEWMREGCLGVWMPELVIWIFHCEVLWITSFCSFFWVSGWLPSFKSKRKMMEEEGEKGIEEEEWGVEPKEHGSSWALSRYHKPFIHSANCHRVRQSPKAHRSE